MEELSDKIYQFSKERDWLKYNTPENLAKAISIESGELLECFHWKSDFEQKALEEEIADVMTYCFLLCKQIGCDPKKIILDKMEVNKKKYPIDKCYGKSDKYNKLD